jgi:SAM-dependent methyltransferase
MAQQPPLIFAPQRRLAARRRMLRRQRAADAPRYLMADMTEDVIERLGFLRIEPKRALIIGDWTGTLAAELSRRGQARSVEPADGFDEERPFPFAGFDFIASLGTLDTVNDLPGALIHIRNALAPGGLMIASLMGAGSLPALRAAMLAADGERPAPRLHPQVDVRAGGQLLQRTGFGDPVIDSRGLDASFRSLGGLIADLRAMGLSNVLARHGPALGKVARARAEETFEARKSGGRTAEHFEILTLSGWKK